MTMTRRDRVIALERLLQDERLATISEVRDRLQSIVPTLNRDSCWCLRTLDIEAALTELERKNA